MKESSKERLATLLMDELLERLSARESLRKVLGEMTSLPIDDVVEHLLNDFERVVEEYRQKHVSAPKQPAEKRPKQTREETTAEISGAVQENTVEAEAQSVSISTASAAPSTETPRAVELNPEPVPSEPAAVEQPKPESMKKPVSGQEQVKAEPEKLEPARHADVPQAKDDDARKKAQSMPSVKLDPIKLEFPKIRLKAADKSPATISPPPPPVAQETLPLEERKDTPHAGQPPAGGEEELRRLEELARKIEAEYASRKKQQQLAVLPGEEPAGDAGDRVAPKVEETAISVSEDDEEIVGTETGGPAKQTTRARYNFSDDDYVYVHAVGRIPDGENSVADPFMLEEKGIDGHEFAFAFDYTGMRFYLSKINPEEMSVSKAMVLLLNKQESIQVQGVHESILNDLRGHGVLLPFDFGTVARGKDYFVGLLDKNLDDLQDALDEVEKTTWWTVTASVLDSTIARIVGTEVQSIGRDRTRDRASYTSSPQGKKFDIKVLERILQREKKLAESIHEALSAVADRSDVDTMIGLGSGSSEDWKVILKGSYDVPKRNIGKFNRTVTDLQYHHLQFDLMLALAGDKESFTLRRK